MPKFRDMVTEVGRLDALEDDAELKIDVVPLEVVEDV